MVRNGGGAVPVPREPAREDEELLSMVVGGDAAAFAALYDRHGRVAYSLAYRMMGERQAAEDLVQEAFLRVWRAADTYLAERGSVKTWILSIVRNRGVDELRAGTRRRRARQGFELTAPRSQPCEAFGEAWANSQHLSRREQVQVALRTLPCEQLEIVRLAYFHGHTHVEISELLGLPLGTVKGRLRLARDKLRTHFGALHAPRLRV